MTREEYVKEVNAAFAAGDYARARQLGEAMVRDGIHNGHLQMAGADNLLGNLSRAEEEIKTYLAQSDDADGWQLYGLIRFNAGDYLKAAEFFDKSAERGSVAALGIAAASRFTYVNQHVYENTNNVEKNLLHFDLTERAIAQSVECIRKNPKAYNYYGLLPQMLYLDYYMIASGWTSYSRVETEGKSVNTYAAAGGNSLLDMNDALNDKQDFAEQQKAKCRSRAAQIAQLLRDVGREAEASMVMFEMLYAEVGIDGKEGSAAKAAQYYSQALQTARASLSDAAYKAWTEEFQDETDDYQELMQRHGKLIKKVQENGGKTAAEKAKAGFSLWGVVYAVGTTPLIPLVLVLAGGLLAMFGRFAGRDGNPVGMVGLIVFGLILLAVGMVVGVKRNRNANPNCLRVGAVVLFLLSFLHIIAGLVAAVAAGVAAKMRR